jgi:thiol-disulfide isomerase/thioredoxin
MKKYGILATVIAFVALFSVGIAFYNNQKDKGVDDINPQATSSPIVSGEQNLASPAPSANVAKESQAPTKATPENKSQNAKIQNQTDIPNQTNVPAQSATPQPTQTVAPVRTEPKAKNITLKTTDGRTVSLSDYKGKVPVVINFWASWCPPCRAEMVYFDKYSKIYGEDKVVFLMIDLTDGQRETISKATKYLSDSGFNFRNVLLDTASRAAMDYNISSIPQSFFVDKDGYIINSHTGSIQESTLKKYLENLIN